MNGPGLPSPPPASRPRGRIPYFPHGVRILVTALVAAAFCLAAQPGLSQEEQALQRQEFQRAWRAASRGDRREFERLMPGLEDYLLYPYLQYEDLRHRRARADEQEMAEFLAGHEGWAFTGALRRSWLMALGKHGRWDALLRHGRESDTTEIRCYLAQARIERGETDGLLPEARALWTSGKSQPDACDPVFAWLIGHDGITPGLAWKRVRLAMEAGQRGLAGYLARFVPLQERRWVERWRAQQRSAYRDLRQARNWPDLIQTRDIASHGLRYLARREPDRAWRTWQTLKDRFRWDRPERLRVLREIALWSAVEGVPGTPKRMQSIPAGDRDGRLLEWWARYSLSQTDWKGLIHVIAQMPAELRADARWRYWSARGRHALGDRAEAAEALEELALETHYYGFLAADLLDRPYTICPQRPRVDPLEVDALRARADFRRALELRRAGLLDWSRGEWRLAAARLVATELRAAAALAVEEDWPEMAIFALGNSGDLQWYEWRFPVEISSLVEPHAKALGLDTAWVMGLVRSESAMAEDAVSPAGARGLMQLTPNTARQLARRHGFDYRGPSQLMTARDNVLFGTTYLRELLDRFGQNPVLAAGAYNAGPNAVKRWLKQRPGHDPAVWVETLPYFETRDYIPRVLAFSTLYDWRLGREVSRIGSRMPALDSATGGRTMQKSQTAEVVCGVPG